VLASADCIGTICAHERLVRNDAHQPCAEACLGPEIRKRPVGLEVRFLERVLGVLVVAQDGARGAEKRSVVPAHQHLES
jgi:hypothetical protein